MISEFDSETVESLIGSHGTANACELHSAQPMKQGLELVGSATLLRDYVQHTYEKLELPLLAPTTQKAYKTHLDRYVLPKFGDFPLRELTAMTLQEYFSGLANSPEGPATVLKIKQALSSVMASAKKYELVPKNPLEGIDIPQSKVLNRKKKKPILTVEELDLLLTEISEPYPTW